MPTLALLVETSNEACSVALADITVANAPRVLAEAEETTPMRHTAVLLPLIRAAFAKTDHELADLSAVAVSTGPGSYTALRAGYASAKGLCMALDVPLIEVSTMRALASVASEMPDFEQGDHVHTVLPARRSEVYYARYTADLDLAQKPMPRTVDAAWINSLREAGPLRFAGPNLSLVSPLLNTADKVAEVVLHARNLLKITAFKYSNKAFTELSNAAPLYVKPPYITRAKPRL